MSKALHITPLSDDEQEQMIKELKDKIEYIEKTLKIKRKEIESRIDIVCPKNTENIYLINDRSRLIDLIIKSERLITLYYKRKRPGTGVSLNFDYDVFELWLFAEVLYFLAQNKITISKDKRISLAGERFRETSFELRALYAHLLETHKVDFISEGIHKSPDILANGYVIECKTTNPEKYTQMRFGKDEMLCWNKVISKLFASHAKLAIQVEFYEYIIGNRSWEEFIQDIESLIISDKDIYESERYCIKILRKSFSLEANCILQFSEKLFLDASKSIEQNIQDACLQIQSYGKPGIIYLNISNNNEHRGLFKGRQNRLQEIIQRVFDNYQSNLVYGVMFGYDEIDDIFKGDYKNYNYLYHFGDGFVSNSNYTGVELPILEFNFDATSNIRI